jgi:tRNA dimethylallyltransferase
VTANGEQPHIFAIAGPTASGKTALGVALASLVGGEVINFDSVQIYREIKIATAKPSEEEKQGIQHHLIDYVDPRINYTAADWALDAAVKIAEIEGRGRVPILVGGTGFYLRTLMRPLFESPKTDDALRRRLRALKEKKGAERMHAILSRVDPAAAAGLSRRDHVRVIRALEVYLQTGSRISERHSDRPSPPEFASRVRLIVLNPPREELYDKIDRRTEIHFRSGLVEEVAALRRAGVADSTNALGSHGYRRVCEYLRGERTLSSALAATKQDVRNYAKRQLTWFRAESEAVWLDGFGQDPGLADRALVLAGGKVLAPVNRSS